MVTSVCGPSPSGSSSSSYGSSRSSSSSSRSGAMSAQRSSRDREGIGGRRDVVHAEDARAALVRVLAAGEPPEEGLARGPEHDREPELDDLAQAVEQLEVVVNRLAEPDARVEHDALLGDALGDRERGALLEERLDLGDDVVVARVDLHRARLAEHVHEAAVAAVLCDKRR